MQIGPYKLVRKLGQGGMAQVWLARRIFDDGERSCVIKFPLENAVADEVALRQFMVEVRLSLSLVHCNIISAFDSGSHEGLPYLVMDYVPGVDLEQLHHATINGSDEWDVESAVHVIREIGSGLSYAHNRTGPGVPNQIIHRDVASKNVMIDGDGGVRLMDFGVATSASSQTSKLHVKGTLRYMAPEHYLGTASAASDVFSLGVVFWELLSGKICRVGLEGSDLIKKVVAGDVGPLDREVPDNVRMVLEGMLNPDPSLRITLPVMFRIFDDYPFRKRQLRTALERWFGRAGKKTGHSQAHFVGSPELEGAFAVAKASNVSLSRIKQDRGPGRPDPVPVDFIAGSRDDTSRVDPNSMGADLDDELHDLTAVDARAAGADSSDSTASRGSLGEPLSTADGRTALITKGTERPPLSAATAILATSVSGEQEGAPQQPTVFVSPPAPVVSSASQTGSAEEAEHRAALPRAESRVTSTAGSRPFDSARVGAPGVAAQRHPSLAAKTATPFDLSIKPIAPRWPWAVAALVVVALGVGIVSTIASSSESGAQELSGRGSHAAREVRRDPAVVPAAAPEQEILEVEFPPEPTMTQPDLGVVLPQDASPVEHEPRATPEVETASLQDAPPAATEEQPTKRPKPSTRPRGQKVEIMIRRGLAVSFAQIRVGKRGKVRDVPSRGGLALSLLSPGNYKLWWRNQPDGEWKPKRLSLSADKIYAANVETSSLRISVAPRGGQSK